ncbi:MULTISPECIES: DUF1850 domain-containing protein [Alphaproteobacteria]|uniref:DUF1850 domain-containing protein n=2 Tax=Alphaproteobacteria TaxID=28211 RepID=A0A512HF97_9HYPH|nr:MULTISPECIES: DUF1850 domain-containing protein [Alphaproteobacteria]GEO84111.1 hypothetical protein RNA01_10430 [Ciceribacter naphthalenivorans]GLR24647.1 hypothetical protein GCM10007920_44410 [Ciceribacter naphthalenivorans]GLT07503.1 hypothetical protein GCM10007926_44410 [Sphingomonas psychrolutea]
MTTSVCIVAGAKAMSFAVSLFSLAWTHSVQKTEWQEDWTVTPAGLQLMAARVKGSGAGMDPGDGAVLKDGWWEWQPANPPVSDLRLAASGMTGGGWHFCHAGGCAELGAKAGEDVVIRPCPDGETLKQG